MMMICLETTVINVASSNTGQRELKYELMYVRMQFLDLM